MEKIRLVYLSLIFLLLFLVAYLIYTSLYVSGQKARTGMQVETVKLDGMYIVKFDIFNNEDHRVNYIIHVQVGEDHFRDSVSIKGDYLYTYRHNVYSKNRTRVDMNITIYREGEPEPWEQTSLSLVFQ